MINSAFGREFVEIHQRELREQAAHQSLVGRLKKDRRERRLVKRAADKPCPMDAG